MRDVPFTFQNHIVINMLLITLVPFTRLVHMFSALVRYLFRPDIVDRFHDPRLLGERAPRRGGKGIDR